MDYKEKLEEAKRLYETANADQKYLLESLFPELKSKADERIRKDIISFLRSKNGYMNPNEDWDFRNRWLPWLEKHGEQKPADKIEPRFKVGDIIKPKDKGHEPWQIMQVDILNKEYRFKDGYVVHFSQEDAYELVDKKFTAWSEEDEAMCNSIIDTEQQMIEIINGIQKVDEIQKIFTDTEPFKERYYKEIRWIESIKNRLQSKSLWKPTDEQIGALEEVIGDGDSEILISLYNDLKQL